MSLDPSLADQRQMIRDLWARDTGWLRQPARPHPEASRQPPAPAPGQLLPDVPAEDGRQVRTGPQTTASEQSDQERARSPAVAQPGARAPWMPWECPEDLPDGQREVLQLLHLGRVDLAAVLRSRDRDAQALSVRNVLEADRRLGPARAGQVMASVGTGDVAVSQLAPAQVEGLLAAADGRLP